MSARLVKQFVSTIQDTEHPYLSGAWTPNTAEYDATEMEVIGEIPRDLQGVYLRNTENPLMQPIGRYHPFDGDGMIHAMVFADGKAEYRNRFVRTKGLLEELAEGHALWAGIAENPAKSLRPGNGAHGGLKDSSSTDVVVHAGKALSTFYQCGEGYRLDPVTLETLGTESWVPPEGISAHPKVDERTGELLFFNYSKQAPYQHYGVVNADNELVHMTPVPLPGPRLPHDMAFTENYSILADLPVFWDEEALKHNIHAARLHEGLPSRFAIIPRYGNTEDIRWFAAKPTYVLHWMNAWEEGDEIVLDGYFQENPMPEPLPGMEPKMARLMANIDMHSLKPRLHRWRFNLKTGAVSESHHDDQTLEFGTFNQQVAGRPSRYNYSVTSEPGYFAFTGLVKHDLQTGQRWETAFGPGRYGSEAPFAPRLNARSEDDGYLLSFITDMAEDCSECLVLDAQQVEAGPVCRIRLPHRISSGTHACWAPL